MLSFACLITNDDFCWYWILSQNGIAWYCFCIEIFKYKYYITDSIYKQLLSSLSTIINWSSANSIKKCMLTNLQHFYNFHIYNSMVWNQITKKVAETLYRKLIVKNYFLWNTISYTSICLAEFHEKYCHEQEEFSNNSSEELQNLTILSMTGVQQSHTNLGKSPYRWWSWQNNICQMMLFIY